MAGRHDPGAERDVEALRTDRYLESLLLARDRAVSGAPADAELDPGLRAVADRLARDLVRIHPSFRFEERLAARLSAAAGPAEAAGEPGRGELIPFGARPAPAPALASSPPAPRPGWRPEPGLAPVLADRGRPLLIGGAMASAALSIAGAAWVAWRRTRPPAHRGDAWLRAVRALRGGAGARPGRGGWGALAASGVLQRRRAAAAGAALRTARPD